MTLPRRFEIAIARRPSQPPDQSPESAPRPLDARGRRSSRTACCGRSRAPKSIRSFLDKGSCAHRTRPPTRSGSNGPEHAGSAVNRKAETIWLAMASPSSAEPDNGWPPTHEPRDRQQQKRRGPAPDSRQASKPARAQTHPDWTREKPTARICDDARDTTCRLRRPHVSAGCNCCTLRPDLAGVLLRTADLAGNPLLTRIGPGGERKLDGMPPAAIASIDALRNRRPPGGWGRVAPSLRR